MSLRKWLNSGTILGMILLIVTGCSNSTSSHVSAGNLAKNNTQSNAGTNKVDTPRNRPSTINPQPKWTPVHNVLLAKSNVPGRSGQELELVDVTGQYANNPVPGPFQGKNWIGHFQLRVVNSTGKVLSKFDLPYNKYTQMGQLLIMGKFQFHFADYNGDGNPDFTLGQYFSSNGYIYELFTIKPSGLYQLSISPTALLFVSGFTTYSPRFKLMKPNGFQIKYYDNSKTEWFQATYTWKNGKFVQSSIKETHIN